MFSQLRRHARDVYRHYFNSAALEGNPRFNYFLIDDDPVIILTFTPGGLEHVRTMAKRFATRPCHFLVGFWWSMADKGRVTHLERSWNKIHADFPNASLHLLCNAQEELTLFRKHTRIPCSLVNHNCFLDEELYTVMPEVEKRFDAVYSARMGAYKRLELAERVQSLVVITAPMGKDIGGDYFDMIRERLGHAHWPNFDKDWRYMRLPAYDVQRYLNTARTGLMLSKKEGACYASGEYLLSGIPIITTPSSGGRDEFYTEETAIVVEATPGSIAEAVRVWASRKVDPWRVRQVTLDIVWQHRRRLFRVIDEIRHRYGVDRAFEDEWHELFMNKMRLFDDEEKFSYGDTMTIFKQSVQKEKTKYALKVK